MRAAASLAGVFLLACATPALAQAPAACPLDAGQVSINGGLEASRPERGFVPRFGSGLARRLPVATPNPAFRARNPALGQMARSIALEGDQIGYAVQHRFEAMAGWSGLDRGGVGPDDLHLNDEGYDCWAETSAEGLAAGLR